MKTTESTDFDFRNSLYNTLVLLGCKIEIARLLKKSMDFGVTDADVERLRVYNTALFFKTKEKLTQINTTKICVSRDESKGG